MCKSDVGEMDEELLGLYQRVLGTMDALQWQFDHVENNMLMTIYNQQIVILQNILEPYGELVYNQTLQCYLLHHYSGVDIVYPGDAVAASEFVQITEPKNFC